MIKNFLPSQKNARFNSLRAFTLRNELCLKLKSIYWTILV